MASVRKRMQRERDLFRLIMKEHSDELLGIDVLPESGLFFDYKGLEERMEQWYSEDVDSGLFDWSEDNWDLDDEDFGLHEGKEVYGLGPWDDWDDHLDVALPRFESVWTDVPVPGPGDHIRDEDGTMWIRTSDSRYVDLLTGRYGSPFGRIEIIWSNK